MMLLSCGSGWINTERRYVEAHQEVQVPMVQGEATATHCNCANHFKPLLGWLWSSYEWSSSRGVSGGWRGQHAGMKGSWSSESCGYVKGLSRNDHSRHWPKESASGVGNWWMTSWPAVPVKNCVSEGGQSLHQPPGGG